MKRTLTVTLLVIFGLAALCYGVPRWRLATEQARRSAAEAAELENSKPLVLDATTQAILSGADRVETFRLAGGDMDYTPQEAAMLDGPHPQYLENHSVIGVGPAQGHVLATALAAAVGQVAAEPDMLQCFDPVIGFRAWKGQAHTDICVCFFCGGIEIITKDAHHKTFHQSLTTLGRARSAFLVLSKQAFPQDKTLAVLK